MVGIDEVTVQYFLMVLENRVNQIKLETLRFEVEVSANLVEARIIPHVNGPSETQR